MEGFERIDEVEASLESIRLSLFRDDCNWDREIIKREEKQILFSSMSNNELDNLIELNYIYIYDQDEVVVRKNKIRNKGEGQDMILYKRVFRKWQKIDNLRKVDFYKHNYDLLNKKVEIIILCKKYICYPRVQQIEEIIDLMTKKLSNIQLNRTNRKLYSLLSSACLVHEFYQSQFDSFKKKKQKLAELQEEQEEEEISKNSKNSQNKEQSNKDKYDRDKQSKVNENRDKQDKEQEMERDEQQKQQQQQKQQYQIENRVVEDSLGDKYEQQMHEESVQKMNSAVIIFSKKLQMLYDSIWKIVDLLSSKMTYSGMIKCLLIGIQYECTHLSQYFYAQLREYILRYQDVISYENENAFLQSVIRNSSREYLQVSTQSEVITVNAISPLDLNKVEQMHVDTLFFKKDYTIFYSTHAQLKQQIQKYQYFNLDRTRTDNLEDFAMSENDYPHYYHLRNMHDKNQLLIGIQNSEHSSIELYIDDNYTSIVDASQYKKYDQNYAGYIDRNYWGTQFILYSEGYAVNNNSYTQEIDLNNHKDLSYSLLRYFLPTEKCSNLNYSLVINYETNIMADAPRKFTAKAYNYKERKFVEMKSLEPVYNEETQTYQLNFYGRAKKASARNFQLQDVNDENQVFLLHGKNKKNQFSLDFSYPLNILQAFAFSIVSISKKFLVA